MDRFAYRSDQPYQGHVIALERVLELVVPELGLEPVLETENDFEFEVAVVDEGTAGPDFEVRFVLEPMLLLVSNSRWDHFQRQGQRQNRYHHSRLGR